MEKTRERRFLIISSCLLLIAGLLFNERFLVEIFSSDGIISAQNQVIIRVVSSIFIIVGIILLFFGKNLAILVNIFLFFLSIIIALSSFEIFLRLVDDNSKVKILTRNSDGRSSYTLMPNKHIVMRMGNKLININTNSHGMRWRESSYVKDSGKIRIAFLGDSYTFGCWSGNNSNDFVGVFDASLDKRKFETLNFGVPGYGLCDIELKIKEQVLLFKPDYLILCFFNGNDFRDTYLGVDKYDIVNGVAVLNRKLFEEKIPTPFRERLNSVSVQECKKNWIVPLTKLKIYRFLELYLAGINSKKSIDFSVNNSFNSYTFWSQKSYPEIAVKSKDLSLETLNRIWKICNENTIRLMIITIPFKEQVYSSQESGVDYDINLPQKYIEDFSKRRSILYLDLLPLLRAELKAGAKDIYYQYDEHFNEDGHRIVGNLISKYFKEKESKETNRN